MSTESKLLTKTFVQDNTNLNEDEAAHLIIKSIMLISELKEEMSSDERILAAVQIKKDLEEGYKSVIKSEQAKIHFLVGKIKEIQGGVNPNASV